MSGKIIKNLILPISTSLIFVFAGLLPVAVSADNPATFETVPGMSGIELQADKSFQNAYLTYAPSTVPVGDSVEMTYKTHAGEDTVVTAVSSDDTIAKVTIEGRKVVVTAVSEGTAIITVTGSETDTYYSGTAMYRMNVVSQRNSNGGKMMKITPPDCETVYYNGTAKTPKRITVEDPAEGALVRYGTEMDNYTLAAPPKFTEIGLHTIYYRVIAYGYITTTGSYPFEIAERPAFKDYINVRIEGSYSYTGSEIIPRLTVTANMTGTILTEGKDYEVEISDNINAGTARVAVHAIGDYQGEYDGTFTIMPAAPTDYEITFDVCLPASSETIPAETVKVGSRTLQKGTDYNISYALNPESPFGTATVDFLNNYTGTVIISFEQPGYAVNENDSVRSWKKGSEDGIVILANGNVAKYLKTVIDGMEFNAASVTGTDSTTVKISADDLKNMAAGNHSIRIYYQDGHADTSFTVIYNWWNDTTTLLLIGVFGIFLLLLIILLIVTRKGKKKSL